MKTVNLCIFGDSIAYGSWDASGGWVDRLRSYLHGVTLASRFQSYYFAYHLGIPGNTTGDVLARLPHEAKMREPHVIIFAVGINDARWRVPGQIPHVDEDTFRRNIVKLIAEGRRFTQMIVFVGLTAVDETKTMPFDPACYFENERIRRYDAILREIVTTAEIIYPYTTPSRPRKTWKTVCIQTPAGMKNFFCLSGTSLKNTISFSMTPRLRAVNLIQELFSQTHAFRRNLQILVLCHHFKATLNRHWRRRGQHD